MASPREVGAARCRTGMAEDGGGHATSCLSPEARGGSRYELDDLDCISANVVAFVAIVGDAAPLTRQCEAPSAGIEPAHTAPEAAALSAELRGRDGRSYRRDQIQFAGCPPCWWSTTTPSSSSSSRSTSRWKASRCSPPG